MNNMTAKNSNSFNEFMLNHREFLRGLFSVHYPFKYEDIVDLIEEIPIGDVIDYDISRFASSQHYVPGLIFNHSIIWDEELKVFLTKQLLSRQEESGEPKSSYKDMFNLVIELAPYHRSDIIDSIAHGLAQNEVNQKLEANKNPGREVYDRVYEREEREGFKNYYFMFKNYYGYDLDLITSEINRHGEFLMLNDTVYKTVVKNSLKYSQFEKPMDMLKAIIT